MRPWITLLVAALPSILVPSTPAVAVDLCYTVTSFGTFEPLPDVEQCVPYSGPVTCLTVTPEVLSGSVIVRVCRPTA